MSRRARSSSRRSDCLEIGRRRLAAPLVRFDLEAELLTLDQTAHAGALHGRDVNEHVWAAILLLNEAEALLGVEKLHSTRCHFGLFENAQMRLARITIHGSRYPDLACSWERPVAGRARQAKSRMTHIEGLTPGF